MTTRLLFSLWVAVVCVTGHAGTGLPAQAAESVSDEQLGKIHREAFAQYEVARAIEVAERQLALRHRTHGTSSIEVAATLHALATYETLLPDYEAAEAHAREALAIRQQILGGKHADVAASQRRLALTLRDLDRLDEAEQLLRAALAVEEELLGDDDPVIAATRTDLGMVLTEHDKLDEAESQLRRALEEQRAFGERRELDEAETLRWLAQCLVAQKRFEDAEETAKQSLEIRRRLHTGPHLDVAESLDLLAEIYHGQQFLDDAARSTKQALAIRRELVGNDHPLTVAGMHNLAVIEMSVGNHAKAEPLLRQVLASERRSLGDAHPDVAFTLSTLAINLSEQGRYAEAQPYYAETRKILHAIDPNHPDLRWLLDYWARDADKRGDLKTAEARYLEVSELIQRAEGREAWWLIVSVAGLRVAGGDYLGAEEFLLSVVPAHEEIRVRIGSGIKAATAAGSPYVSLALVQLELGKTAEAWAAMEKTRGRSLTELLAERYGSPGDLGTDKSLGRGFAFSRERVQRTLEPGTAIVGWVDHEVRKGSPASWGYVLRHEGPVHWARLDRLGTTSKQELSGKFSAYRRTVSSIGTTALGEAPSTDSVDEGARALWLARFGPLDRWLDGVESLVVIPSEIMAGLAVESLVGPDGVVVGDRFTVSYSPSATIHAWLRERSSPDRKVDNALLVGDPPFRQAHLAAMKAETVSGKLTAEARPDHSVLRSALGGDRSALGSLPRLAWSRWEVRRVGELLAGETILVGPQASEVDLASIESDRLQRFDVLHFATHALVDGQRPNCSSLILSQIGLPEATGNPCDEPADDGMLTGDEIAAGWQLDSELVTLSACETGLGRNVHHEGVIGFSHPFLQAGTQSLLVSLWKVDDQATALLMERFYENWIGEGGDGEPESTKVEALQQAKIWLREYEDAEGRRPYEHPYYWSAFVLIGDPR